MEVMHSPNWPRWFAKARSFLASFLFVILVNVAIVFFFGRACHQPLLLDKAKLNLPAAASSERRQESRKIESTSDDSTTATESIKRTPHIDCEAGDRVEPGAKISVTVYADSAPSRNNEGDITPVELKVPKQVQDVPVTVYLLLSEQFHLRENADSKELVIHKDPTIVDTLKFKLKVEDGTAGSTGSVTALFFHKGYPCGRLTRYINIGYSDDDNQTKTTAIAPFRVATTPPDANAIAATVPTTTPIRSSTPRDGPDMTIVVIQTDLGRYQYFVLAPDSKDPHGQVDYWTNYSNPVPPQQILESYYEHFGKAYPPQQARNSLFDLEKNFMTKLRSELEM